MLDLGAWDSFYVIVGSAAGALIGLQFVVMTLMADSPARAGIMTGAAFGSPTVVHFSMALLLAAIVRVPWPGLHWFQLALGAMGVLGMVYMGIVARRMLVQDDYRPDLEDWLFHLAVPFASYALVLAAAVAAFERWALFGVGVAALMLLYDGIHNSWDSVAYHVFVVRRKAKDPNSSR
ncbi:MAG TPA: hypothetical protein VN718_05655 [Rhizomicrobium sp.]|nr:hypothetical protein [Rhizomicrobium sp.]